MTRPVMVFKWWRPDDAKFDVHYEKVEVGAGNFHQFGTNFEEFENGAASFSSAIVEMPDGNVINVSVEMIRFDD